MTSPTDTREEGQPSRYLERVEPDGFLHIWRPVVINGPPPPRRPLPEMWRNGGPSMEAVLDRRRHRVNGFDERMREWADQHWPAVSDPGLVQGYVDGEVGIRVDLHARFPALDSEVRDLCVVLQKQHGVYDSDLDDSGGEFDAELGLDVLFAGPDHGEHPMPVTSSEFVQDSEILVDGLLVGDRFPSVVRLYGFDDGPTLLREWADLPSCVYEELGGAADGERKLLDVGGWLSSSVSNRGSVDAGIQAGAEVVDDLPEPEAEDRREGVVALRHGLELTRFRGYPTWERGVHDGENRYPPEFREQMVELVTGRTPESLSREFEPTAQDPQLGQASMWMRDVARMA